MGYEGSSKWWTSDCPTCPYRHLDFCYWGKYTKHLSTHFGYGEEHKVRHCEFRNREPAQDSAYHLRFGEIPAKKQKKQPSPQGKLL